MMATEWSRRFFYLCQTRDAPANFLLLRALFACPRKRSIRCPTSDLFFVPNKPTCRISAGGKMTSWPSASGSCSVLPAVAGGVPHLELGLLTSSPTPAGAVLLLSAVLAASRHGQPPPAPAPPPPAPPPQQPPLATRVLAALPQPPPPQEPLSLLRELQPCASSPSSSAKTEKPCRIGR